MDDEKKSQDNFRVPSKEGSQKPSLEFDSDKTKKDRLLFNGPATDAAEATGIDDYDVLHAKLVARRKARRMAKKEEGRSKMNESGSGIDGSQVTRHKKNHGNLEKSKYEKKEDVDNLFDGQGAGTLHDEVVEKELQERMEARRKARKSRKEKKVNQKDSSEAVSGKDETKAGNGDAYIDGMCITDLLNSLLDSAGVAREGTEEETGDTSKHPAPCLKQSSTKKTAARSVDNGDSTIKKSGVYWNCNVQSFRSSVDSTQVEEEMHFADESISALNLMGLGKQGSCVSGDIETYDDSIDDYREDSCGRVMIHDEFTKGSLANMMKYSPRAANESIEEKDTDYQPRPSMQSSDKTQEQTKKGGNLKEGLASRSRSDRAENELADSMPSMHNREKRSLITATNRDGANTKGSGELSSSMPPIKRSGGKDSAPRSQSRRMRLEGCNNKSEALGSSMLVFNTIAKKSKERGGGESIMHEKSDTLFFKREGSSSEEKEQAAGTIRSIMGA